MAAHILLQDATLSSGAGWRRLEAYNLPLFSGGTAVGLNVERTQAVTFANAGNQVGIFLYLSNHNMAFSSVVLTVKLQENVAGTWTDRVLSPTRKVVLGDGAGR